MSSPEELLRQARQFVEEERVCPGYLMAAEAALGGLVTGDADQAQVQGKFGPTEGGNGE